MKIIERYGIGFRLLRGAGGWALFNPLKFVLSSIYRLWPRVGAGRRSGARQAPRIPSSSVGGARARIVSVGNLEVGGGGKTPCTLALADAIRRRGGRPVVVSRGYRGTARRSAPIVVPAGRTIGASSGAAYSTEDDVLAASGSPKGTVSTMAALLGDEIMLYRSRGIPVVIDAVRARGAGLAEELFAATHVLLDDAFQNHSIGKDVDIVLLDAERPFGNRRLLPLGPLREPPSAVARADVVIFTRTRKKEVPCEAEPFVEGKSLFFAAHEPVDLLDRTGVAMPLATLSNSACILFSGVARPASFEELIAVLGAKPRLAFRFVDHHRYTEGDIRAMLRDAGADTHTPFITTEKDWGKVRELFPPEVTLHALRIEMEISEIETLIDQIG